MHPFNEPVIWDDSAAPSFSLSVFELHLLREETLTIGDWVLNQGSCDCKPGASTTEQAQLSHSIATNHQIRDNWFNTIYTRILTIMWWYILLCCNNAERAYNYAMPLPHMLPPMPCPPAQQAQLLKPSVASLEMTDRHSQWNFMEQSRGFITKQI